MLLVDTSVWIDFLKGIGSPHRKILHELIEDDEDIAITGIVLTEILQGIKSDFHYKQVKEYLLEFSMYEPSGVETFIMASNLYRNCRKRGKTVRTTVDCIISAICIENNLTLLHKDSNYDSISANSELKVLRI